MTDKRRARVGYQYPMHEFKIADAQAHREWEQLLGCTLHSDTVKLTHEAYVKAAWTIQDIQLKSAFRNRSKKK